MKTIKDYLTTMFINLPETPELIQLKQDLLANMEDRYQELIAAGHSENEAIGQVITEFGNLDELLAEMDLAEGAAAETVPLPLVSQEEAFAYTATKRQVGLGIGAGVFFSCLAAAALMGLISLQGFGWSLLSAAIGIIILTISLVLGVGLFIVNGFRNQRYEYLQKDFVMTGSTRKAIEAAKQNYERSHIFCITVGVALCIMALIPVIIGSLLEVAEDSVMLLCVGALLLLAGAGSFFFVYTGNIKLGYEILLQHGKLSQPTPETKKQRKIEQIFENIYWPIVVVIFFAGGFSGFGWGFGTSWIIFPIAGICENIIKTVLGIEVED